MDYITYFRITRKSNAEESVVYHPVNQYPSFLWTNLEPATEFTFHVSACNGYTMECGTVSQAVKGTTEDGKSGPPSNVLAACNYDNISGMNYVDVQWNMPLKPNGQIEFYNVSLKSNCDLTVILISTVILAALSTAILTAISTAILIVILTAIVTLTVILIVISIVISAAILTAISTDFDCDCDSD
jgi:hypothetical protein